MTNTEKDPRPIQTQLNDLGEYLSQVGVTEPDYWTKVAEFNRLSDQAHRAARLTNRPPASTGIDL